MRDTREKVLEVAIGREVRAFRKKLGITVADLAVATDISLGMLSKIENGITSPSLTTLQALSRALGVPVTAFFRRFEEERSAVFVKAGEGLDVERRGTRAGHQYNLLGHIGSNTSGVVVEPYLITLTEDSDVFPTFQHEGMEFLYMLEGEVVYRHGSNLYPHEARRQPVLRRRCAARAGGADRAADALSVDHLLSAEQRGVSGTQAAPLTRIANRIAKGNSGQSDLSPRGEEIGRAGAYLFSPAGRR